MSRLMYISNLGKQIQYIEKSCCYLPGTLTGRGGPLQYEKASSMGR